MDLLPRAFHGLLTEVLADSPAAGLLGPRQVGKSTLARTVAAGTPSRYLDLQDPAARAQLEDPTAFFRRNADRLVVLDEVQLLPSVFAQLRPEIDRDRRNGRFLLLGSASPRLVRDASESLAGRLIYLELTPLSQIEVHSGGIPWETHFSHGGYPQPLLHMSEKTRAQWVASYLHSFVTRDLSELGIAVNAREFERLLGMLAHLHGGQFNASAIARSLRISAPTVQRYVDILEDAFLIRVLRPYFRNFGKRITASPKVYWRDSGLRHHLLGIGDYDALLASPALGSAWEGYAIEEVCRAFGASRSAYYYRTSNGAEIDMILELGLGRRLGFEFKFGSDPSLARGTYNAVSDVRPDRLYVVTPHSERFELRDGIEVCSLSTFLTDIVPEWT